MSSRTHSITSMRLPPWFSAMNLRQLCTTAESPDDDYQESCNREHCTGVKRPGRAIAVPQKTRQYAREEHGDSAHQIEKSERRASQLWRGAGGDHRGEHALRHAH